jgi:hypothetical protein
MRRRRKHRTTALIGTIAMTLTPEMIEAGVIDELVREGRSGRHMYNSDQNDALDEEARAFYRKVISRYRTAMHRAAPAGITDEPGGDDA